MIDERHEELASLYALDLLEGAERAQFETALTRDPELQSLVRELRDASATLAYTGPSAQPPAALKERVLTSITARATTTPTPGNIIRPPSFQFSTVIPWAAAACFALGAAWLGQRYLALQSEALALRDRQDLAAITIESTRQQLEAERIIAERRLQDSALLVTDTNNKLAAANQQLGDARTQLTERDRLIAEARNQLADRDRQLAQARSQLTEREGQIATLTQRMEALAGASAEVGRQLGEAKQQVAQLADELRTQGNLADLKITALASMLKNSPQARAIAIWDPKKQEGLLDVQNLPALAANEDYQFWVVDPQYPNPVDGGVFTVEPTSGKARLQIKTKQPVSAINAFAVTRERKGGVTKAEGPFVLLGK
jgi:anti-sigma-K factor RskA